MALTEKALTESIDRWHEIGAERWAQRARQAAGNFTVCIVCPRQMQTLGMVAFLEQAQPMLDEVGDPHC
jgi:hypothetical protein